MTKYKKVIFEILDHISKEYFSVSRTSEEEKFASTLFSKFKYQVENSDDINIMFMLLKIIAAEGVMYNGARELENPRSDA
jgi:serine protease inhibitor